MSRIRGFGPAAIGLLLLASSVVLGCGFDTSGILSPEGCANKTIVDAELHVDTSDARFVWAVDRLTGAPISLRIGRGYRVASEPDVIIDPAGQAIGRTGDLLVSGCLDAGQGALMIDEGDIRPAGD